MAGTTVRRVTVTGGASQVEPVTQMIKVRIFIYYYRDTDGRHRRKTHTYTHTHTYIHTYIRVRTRNCHVIKSGCCYGFTAPTYINEKCHRLRTTVVKRPLRRPQSKLSPLMTRDSPYDPRLFESDVVTARQTQCSGHKRPVRRPSDGSNELIMPLRKAPLPPKVSKMQSPCITSQISFATTNQTTNLHVVTLGMWRELMWALSTGISSVFTILFQSTIL